MIKKISAFILSLLICCQSTAFADYLEKAEFTSELKINIEGKVPNAPGEKVSILIYPGEADLSGLETATTPAQFFEIADYYREITADDNGNFKLEVLFDDKDKGYRDIKISVAGVAEEYEKAVYVVKESDINTFIADVSNKQSADSGFVTYLIDNLPLIAEESSVYASNEDIRLSVATELLNVRDFMYEGKFDTNSDIKAAFNMAQLVSLINGASSESDINNLITDYKTSSRLDEECFMAYYNDCKSEALGALKSEAPLDAKSFYNLLGETLILSKIKNVSNHNEITDIVNDSNEFLDLDLSSYNRLSDKSSVNKEVMKKTDSLSLFKSSFKSLVDKAHENTNKKPSSPSSSSGSSSSSFGGGGMGNVSFTKDEEIKNEPKVYFNDLQGFDWAKDSINFLAQIGIVNGVGQGKFEPSRHVTREEFVKMIVEAFSSVSVDAENPFADVSDEDWCVTYVATAYQKGMINGVSDTLFGMGDSIKRQDAAVILARISGKTASSNAQFRDMADVSDYAADAVNLMNELKVINGNENGEFLPHNPLTRAECAKIIYALYTLNGEVK